MFYHFKNSKNNFNSNQIPQPENPLIKSIMIKDKQGYFECPCNQLIDCQETEILLKAHIKNCKEFKSFSPLGKVFYKLRFDEFTTEQLKAIKIELNLMTDLLTEHIQIREPWKFQYKKFKNDFEFIQEDYSNGINYNGINIQGLLSSSNRLDDFMIDEETINCLNCLNQIKLENAIFLNNCDHMFCKKCLEIHIKSCFTNAKNFVCLKCPAALLETEMKKVIGDIEFDKLEEEALNSEITQCAYCKEKFLFEPGKVQENMKDEHGKKLTKEQEIHYAQNRFKCPKCSTEQCKECKTFPYHLGKTCEELSKFKLSKHCKYCNEIIKNCLPGFTDICNQPECTEKANFACRKKLPCGDSCCGYKNEKECLPCLNVECAQKNANLLKNQKGDDYCPFCYIEGLINAPCIRAKCGHIFHLKCITTRIEKKWLRPRITFSFCLCPICKSWLEFPEDTPLQQKLKEHTNLFEDIRRKAIERLKYEKRDKDERLQKPGDQYYNKPEEYAVAIYSYYQCFKCKKPYFGGLKSCENLIEEEKNQSEFKPEELICAACSSQGIPLEKCKTHGIEFIEFKCKFCCSVAQWFCWGNTHFCDQCHQKQVNGDYVSKKKKSELPKCQGKATCPLKVDHKENGEEFSLGCSLCRNLMNSHDF